MSITKLSMVGTAVLILSSLLAIRAFGNEAPPTPGLPVVIKADAGNKYLKRIPVPATALRIERVTDARGGAPEALGTTRSGSGKKRTDSPLVFGQPLAGFMERVYGNAFAGDDPAGTPIRLELSIERLDLDRQTGILESGDVVCRARLAVSMITDSASVPVGWLEHEAREPVSTSPLPAQGALVYRAITAFGQALARDDLGLGRLGTAPELSPRRTVAAHYHGPETTFQRSRHELLLGGLVFTDDRMREHFDRGFTLTSGGTSWSTGRSGVRYFLATMFEESGKPEVKDASWTIESRDLSMWAFPASVAWLHGFTSRDQARFAYPYIGLGGYLVWGAERLKVKASRDVFVFQETVDKSLWALRAAIGAQALTGVELRLTPKLAGVVEASWVQSSDGAKVDLGTADRLYEVLGRSDFDFTGWHFGLGLRLYQ